MAAKSEYRARLCRNIREWRRLKGMTQADLADAMSVARQRLEGGNSPRIYQPDVAAIEAGRNPLTADTVAIIAEGLGVLPESLSALADATV